jgi:hypothetical protein
MHQDNTGRLNVRYRIDDGATQVITIPSTATLSGETGYELARLAVTIAAMPDGEHTVEILEPLDVADTYEVDVAECDLVGGQFVQSVGLRP